MTSRWRRRAAAVCIIYLVGVVVVVATTSLLGDIHWLPTVMLFAPRWVYALPIPLLLPLGFVGHGRSRIVSFASIALASVLIVWFNDFRVSPTALLARPSGPSLRVMAYNVGGGSFAPRALVDLVVNAHVDLAGFEECDGSNVDDGAFLEKGYSVRRGNGLCLVTRLPVVLEDIRDSRDMEVVNGSGAINRYEIEWSGRRFNLVLVHLETVREGLEEVRAGIGRPGWKGPAAMRANIVQRQTESRLALEWSRRSGLPTIVMGDFNIPTDSAIYRTYWSGFHNALSERGTGHPVTKTTRWHGMRIDHVLFTGEWTCTKAWIAPHLGMDHRPVVADFRWSL